VSKCEPCGERSCEDDSWFRGYIIHTSLPPRPDPAMSPVATDPSPTVAALHDPTSTAYKKAARHHRKSTRTQQARGTSDDGEYSPFRAAEKRYKARFPPPDLGDVLDLALLDPARAQECALGGWRGRADAAEWREIALKGGAADDDGHLRRGYVLPAIPGARRAFATIEDMRCLHSAP
jgi:hypothetical protein